MAQAADRVGLTLGHRHVISADEARLAQDEGGDLVVARSIEAGGRAKGGVGMIPLLDSTRGGGHPALGVLGCPAY